MSQPLIFSRPLFCSVHSFFLPYSEVQGDLNLVRPMLEELKRLDSVVAPNFYLKDRITAADIEGSKKAFLSSGISNHWINLWPGQFEGTNLEAIGYAKLKSVNFEI